MWAARPGALQPLPTAPTGQRRRSRADAADRRAVHGVAVSRLTADGGDAAGGGGGARDQPQTCAAADAADGPRSAGAETAHDEAHAGAQDIPVSPAELGDRPAEPGVGGGHHLPADRAGVPLSR